MKTIKNAKSSKTCHDRCGILKRQRVKIITSYSTEDEACFLPEALHHLKRGVQWLLASCSVPLSVTKDVGAKS